MSQNLNLFYNLYSKSNNVASAGYTCRSAVDEKDTSFDIINSEGVISDSNGKELANIDLSNMHADGITQYNVETRILQPNSCYLLQGQEYGLSYATYYYIIPKEIVETKNYEKYVESDFDIIYNKFCPQSIHISVKADGENSFVDLVNDDLENANINVRVSLQQLKNECGENREYLVFLSQAEGYFFCITNNKLTPLFQSEDYPYSPFTTEIIGLKNIIYDFIMQFHPVQIGEKYDESTYEVNCELYTWFLYNYQSAINTLPEFNEALQILNEIYTGEHTSEEIDKMIDEINALLLNTPYDLPIISKYDYNNLVIIKNIIESINAIIEETKYHYHELYWLKEDKYKRIPIMKYPNGAFRGIAIIPEWPTNNESEYETSSLYIHHIKNYVTLYKHTLDGNYVPKKYGILSNALLTDEQNIFKHCYNNFSNLSCSCGCINSIPDGWNDVLNIDMHNPQTNLQSEEPLYMGQNCYPKRSDVIGLFKYMQYVFDNDLWTKIGKGYIIIGNKDDFQSHTKNLINSLLIYNPTNVPIRIKYIIFS